MQEQGTYGATLCKNSLVYKTNERYQNAFNYITFQKIISKQSIFVSDRNTNMQFRKNEKKKKIKGHWLPYSTTPNVTTLLTESSQAIHFACIILLIQT